MCMVLPKHIATCRPSAGNGETQTDNVFVTELLRERVVKCEVLEEELPPRANHYPVHTVIEGTMKGQEVCLRRYFKKVDWGRFREVLEECLGSASHLEPIR